MTLYIIIAIVILITFVIITILSYMFTFQYHPKTFQYVLHHQLYDRLELKARLADKAGVKAYMSEFFPEIATSSTYHICNTRSQPTNLPERYVMKATHGSNMTLVVDQPKPDIENIMSRFLKTSYPKLPKWLCDEPQYALIPRAIIFEEHLGDLVDYRFHVFHGEIAVIQIPDSNRVHQCYNADFSRTRQNMYVTDKKSLEKRTAPGSYEVMRTFCREFYKKEGFSYVRIDMYDVAGVPYLGEFTFTPCGLRKRVHPYYDMHFYDLLINE